MKALSVFSGGLDSILAAKVIRAQGIEVQAVFFETPFFSSEKASKSANSIDLPCKIVDITDRHLEMVKNPRHGYGGNMNPCIDCHALMFRIAGEMLQEEGAGFIITGEVLGQRPMSQNRKALSIVDSESGYGGLILRPLTAKNLPLTIPEEKGWVDREKLLAFSGRTRKPQMELAMQLNIHNYPSPAGGCLLTDKVFSKRLKDSLSSGRDPESREIVLLRFGRHFRIGPRTKVIIGRDKKENRTIKGLSREEDLLLTTLSTPGPTVLVLGEILPETCETAAVMAVSYSDADDTAGTDIRVSQGGRSTTLRAKGCSKEELRRNMIC